MMNIAFAVAGTIGICLGAAIAAVADTFPAHVVKFQYGGGGMLISGLMLVAFALPMI
jgi:hypothetical protein